MALKDGATISKAKAGPRSTEADKAVDMVLSSVESSLVPPGQEAAAQSPAAEDRDSFSVTALSDVVDRTTHAAMARFTNGISPAALGAAYLDWATHLVFSPGKQMRLADKAFRKWVRLTNYAMKCAMAGGHSEDCIAPLPQDKRFVDERWRAPPFNVMHQAFLLTQQWWHNATTGVPGVTAQHEKMVEFGSRQLLDLVSPSNYILTNPEVMAQTAASGGMNLVKGWQNFLDDWERSASGKKPAGTEAFRVGQEVAATPGKVVFRNRLIELIQYAPATDKVRPEPILIVPAWIMKYYILDLSPTNSLVKYLVAQGYTVFMISWKNPGPEDRDLGMEEYRKLGIMDALEAVAAIVPDQKVHAVGYCIGGTLLSIAAAAMARDGDERIGTLTFFAAQTDFREAGELMLFINESQLHFLEDMMWEQGFLDTGQMAGAFRMLRSNDLVWSYMVRNYLMGEREPMIDLMAWNADATRMPYRMHTEYLRNLFLNNDLAEGRLRADGRPVALTDIRAPVFSVGTETDHVAPWRSTYKIHLLSDTDVTYVLTKGGHNAGIVSEPGRAHRSYQVRTKMHDDLYEDPETWRTRAPWKEGSWWVEWVAWLDERSGRPQRPPKMGGKFKPIADAPGTYVRMT